MAMLRSLKSPAGRALMVAALVFGTSTPALAIDAPGKVSAVATTFAGKIMLSDKRFPVGAKSAAAYVAQVRKQSKTSFQEYRERQGWKIYLSAHFKAPLASNEMAVKIYDVTEGAPRLVATFEQYSDVAQPTAWTSQLMLERKQFGVNRSLQMAIESQGQAVATARFKILGSAERHTGRVEFTEETTTND